jgi:hypothetical protein
MIAITVTCGLTATGCGEMARQAVKDGLYSYVSGSFSSAQISSQLADLLGNFFTTTGGTTF